MIRPADSDDEQTPSDEDDGRAVAVKEDPQFTLAVTRGQIVIDLYNYSKTSFVQSLIKVKPFFIQGFGGVKICEVVPARPSDKNRSF